MIDVSELMDDEEMGAETLSLRRSSTTFSADGIATAAYVALPFTGIVQPASPSALKFLPEGTRIDNTISIWSAQEMRVGDGDKQQADVIIRKGLSYRVIRLEPWEDAGYRRAYAEGFVT